MAEARHDGKTSQLSSINGWLLVFVILTVLHALYTANSVIILNEEITWTFWYTLDFVRLMGLFLSVLLVCVKSGCARVVYVISASLYVIPMGYAYSTGAVDGYGIGLHIATFTTIAFYTTWINYLYRSKRVAAVLGPVKGRRLSVQAKGENAEPQVIEAQNAEFDADDQRADRIAKIILWVCGACIFVGLVMLIIFFAV